jgi:hypothetical protein
MKVLLYAVFKDHEVMTLCGLLVRIPWQTPAESKQKPEVHSLKAEQCSPANTVAGDRVGRLSFTRAALSICETYRANNLNPTTLVGRRIPD